MKINSIYNGRQRNNEHFQFHTEFKDLVNEVGAEMINCEDQFSAYIACYNDEDIAFQKIVKSAITKQIEDADKPRGNTLRGMIATNKASLKHFNNDVSSAARRIKIVFDTYGNISSKPINEETSAIYNLLQELNDNYSSDMQKVGIKPWATQLEIENKIVEALIKQRVDEQSTKSELKMKETRGKVDTAYNIFVDRINAFIVIEGIASYEIFVRKLNIIIDKYNLLMAQRRGISKAKKQREEEELEKLRKEEELKTTQSADSNVVE